MTEKISVLFIWNVRDELKEYLNENIRDKEVDLLFLDDAKEEDYLSYADQVQVIVGWRPSKKLLRKAKNLKLFINPGAGVQHLIDLFQEINAQRDHPITLVNGHGNSYFTAQHAVALLLTLTNKIISHHKWMEEGKWRRGDSYARSIPLRYRKIGLLGYGAVNSKVHCFLQGFNIDFFILRSSWSAEDETYPTSIKKYTPDQLNAFLAEVDVLILALPLTSKTENMIKLEQLELLGKDGLVVTVARGSIINEDDFYLALREKIITGAAIDVWYQYRPDPNKAGKKYPYKSKNPFHKLDNVVLSPHRGASPMNDLERWDEVVDNIQRIVRGEHDFRNEVDLSAEY